MWQPSSCGGKSNRTIMFSRRGLPTPPASYSRLREKTESFSHSHLHRMAEFVSNRLRMGNTVGAYLRMKLTSARPTRHL